MVGEKHFQGYLCQGLNTQNIQGTQTIAEPTNSQILRWVKHTGQALFRRRPPSEQQAYEKGPWSFITKENANQNYPLCCVRARAHIHVLPPRPWEPCW